MTTISSFTIYYLLLIGLLFVGYFLVQGKLIPLSYIKRHVHYSTVKNISVSSFHFFIFVFECQEKINKYLPVLVESAFQILRWLTSQKTLILHC